MLGIGAGDQKAESVPNFDDMPKPRAYSSFVGSSDSDQVRVQNLLIQLIG
jgi:hypothetical protein